MFLTYQCIRHTNKHYADLQNKIADLEIKSFLENWALQALKALIFSTKWIYQPVLNTLGFALFCCVLLRFVSFRCVSFLFFVVLLCFVLFCFVLICFALFCFALLCVALFCFVWLCVALFRFVLFCFALFCFVVLAPCLAKHSVNTQIAQQKSTKNVADREIKQFLVKWARQAPKTLFFSMKLIRRPPLNTLGYRSKAQTRTTRILGPRLDREPGNNVETY